MKMLINTALANRWRLVYAGCADLRSILSLHLGVIEHLSHTLGELHNVNY
jgi:hypothetical protein